jgi:hypothetical protein
MPHNPHFWLKVAAGFAFAFPFVVFLPGDGDRATPPASTLLTTALVVAFFTAVALYLGLRLDLKFPHAVILYTVGWNVLVVAAKFALGPYGFYEVNQEVEIETILPTLDSPEGAVPGAALIFLLYAAVYWLVYRSFRGGELTFRKPLVVGAFLAGAVVLSAASGVLVLLVLPLFFAAAAFDYLGFVFTSGVSVFVGLTLAGAMTLAILAFRSAAERARVLGDATIVVSLFWVGLAFLALYHALWVVYILILTSIWPLKTVTPK